MQKFEIEELQNSADDNVIARIEKLIQEERRITGELLHHLREIERRMLYAKLGYPSLYDYLTKHFKYSSGAAYRRIAAMRLLREMPELESKMQSGALNLTVAAKAQTYFRDVKMQRQAPLSLDEKRVVIGLLENKSIREAEKTLLEMNPEQIPKDRIRMLTDQLTEIRIIVDEILKNKLDYLKIRLSNKLPLADYKDVVSEASDIAINHFDSALKKNLRAATPALGKQRVTSDFNSLEKPESESQMSRAKISAAIKRAVWARDGGVCTFRTNKEAKPCGSQYRLAYDHIIPVANGGQATVENLRLLCETHNLFEAKRIFGAEHMGQFVEKLKL